MPGQKITETCTLSAETGRAARPDPRAKFIRQFGRDCSGGIAIMAALLMPVLTLGLGLGAETGYYYMTQRNLQNAADLAAHAGAVRLRAGDDEAAIRAAALHVAKAAGFVESDGFFDVNVPPETGPNTGNPASVEVLVTKSQTRFFSAIINSEPVLINARAVANVFSSGSSACVLALSRTDSRAVTVSGSTDVSLDGCDVASNSNASDAFWMSNSSARLTVDCIQSVGGTVSNHQLILQECAAPKENAPVVRDPYADLAEPETSIPCESNVNVSVFNPTQPHPSGMPAMRICGGLDIKSKVVFNPGLYIIDGGDLTMNANGDVSSADVGLTADGVTFFLKGTSTLKFNGNGNLNIQSPSSGPYAGILFFASRSQTGLTHEIRGNFGSTAQGALYAPTSAISFSGNSTATNGCTQIIGLTVEFTGNSTLRSSCSTENGRIIETNVSVRIVE
ncbi:MULTISPECIES: TadE/TadG family type IV pilus assembly protein [unclassified Yoonia]|uniref:TadE/TadG family type IV pilus assembly protein n=1 Tax=unclassified Yoonia TaxID=2629118 RepID=UPI002AFFAE30|nr:MULTISPECIES: TadE/TadG family type IV pilus assembly protein [unclassified Yoonia]